MLFVLSAVAGGLLVGWVLGGSLARLGTVRLRLVWVLVAAVALQLAAAFALSGWSYAAALVVSLLLALAWLVVNGRLAGRVLIGLGLAANALVIVANGAMPVQLSAAARARVATGPLYDDPRHVVADGDTALPWLEDRFALLLPWQPQVLSAGDVLVAAGVGLMITQGMRRRAPRHDLRTPPPGDPVRQTTSTPPPPGRSTSLR